MAKVDLLPRKEFIITLDDGKEIKGKYGVWSLARFCKKNDLTIAQLQARASVDYTVGDMIEMILCAVEQYAREHGESFSYNDVHAGMWIDELGGFGSENLNALAAHQSSDIEKKTIVETPD